MPTLMETETRETPQKIASQLVSNKQLILKLCLAIKEKSPQYAITIGRGSSDHACTYAKYLFETKLGLITASAAPSVVTVYNAKLRMKNALVIGVSQSGQSPDICKMMETARKDGALTIAIVNHSHSELAKTAEFIIPIHVGEEHAVAATKSFIGSLTAIAQLVALLTDDKKLLVALNQLPTSLTSALNTDHWQKTISEFKNISRTFVIARGYGFAIAQEAALKFKETACIQAEAFSAAEVLHGPFALVEKNHPFLLFAQNDETLDGVLNLSRKIQALGGRSILIMPESLHPILDPIIAIQEFYIMVAHLAVARGLNPDQPHNLQKVTKTL